MFPKVRRYAIADRLAYSTPAVFVGTPRVGSCDGRLRSGFCGLRLRPGTGGFILAAPVSGRAARLTALSVASVVVDMAVCLALRRTLGGFLLYHLGQ
jgi:hypothetical protein